MKDNHDNSLTYLCNEFNKYNRISPENYKNFNVKRGLRNKDGTGVLAGLTLISNVHGYILDEGDKIQIDGVLTYRGIDIKDIIANCIKENRYGFEEVIWLLLFDSLPTKEQLSNFRGILSKHRALHEEFLERTMASTPCTNIMNKMAQSVLSLYSYDSDPDSTTLKNVLRQSISLMAKLPAIAVAAYNIKENKSIEGFNTLDASKDISFAEHVLTLIRGEGNFTQEEAHLLDICLILHAEHSGGNNSTFSCRVLSSSGTDTYSAISAAIGSLKGPKHGGANKKVLEMLEAIKEGVDDATDDTQIAAMLRKIVAKEAGDKSGLIYGIGHAVYTLSDPRAVILKDICKNLSKEKGFNDDFLILSAVERLAPTILFEKMGDSKHLCANVDLYSGLIYRELGIDSELFTPLFAVSRIAGWCAHRIEELNCSPKIIRPAYKSLSKRIPYTPIDERN